MSDQSSKDMVPINMRDPFWKDPFFSSTWDEFDKMRNDMMSRSKNFWSKVDEDFANFDDTVKKEHDKMDQQMAPFHPQLPRWAVPEDLRPRWTTQVSQEGNEVCAYILNQRGECMASIEMITAPLQPPRHRVPPLQTRV